MALCRNTQFGRACFEDGFFSVCDASFDGALPHIESKSAGGVDADVRV